MTHTTFKNTIDAIDKLHAEDPNREWAGGKQFPKELLYAKRMTDMLDKFDPEASELLKISARGQHIQRWRIPRESYPMDRKGYLMWRTALKKRHGEQVASLMREAGYGEDERQHVNDLINKRNLKSDPEAQTLEDVVCLVFLQYYLDEFVEKHAGETEKILDILRKTWKKMSAKGHEAAQKIVFSPGTGKLIEEALQEQS